MCNDSPENNVPCSALRQIDLVVDRFEHQWRRGAQPEISAYLYEVPAGLQLLLLAELVCVDLEQRLRKRLSVTLQDYFREFPQLEHLPPADRADLEAHARQRFDELGPSAAAVLTTGPAPLRPQSIGRYPVAGYLGSGGQADVFLSFHPELLVPVVVKWHHAQEAPDDISREQLVREGRILASLTPHPNLVRVYDLGFHEGRAFLVLEHVPGRTLEQYAQNDRPSPRRAAEVVAALARGAHAAHEQGAIHQDINPNNAVLDGLGAPRLIDFGLAWFRPAWADPARARPDGGTLWHLSPEQADPRIALVDRRTDVFGLGAVLYYLLTGQPLYNGTDPHQILKQAAAACYDTAALRQADIPKRLAAVCRKALAREPQQRFATAAELAGALTASVRSPRWRGAAGVAVLIVVAVVGGWLLGQSGRPEPGPEAESPALEVRVWRPETEYLRLAEALPVRTGDELQVRFRAPPGLHIGLFSVNGRGQLSLLEQYPPLDQTAELVYPGRGQTRRLILPVGTEVLLVCGRPGTRVSEEELLAAWNVGEVWPSMAPPRRLLRLQPGQVREEGECPRDFGEIQDRPDLDGVVHRLNGLRERLKQTCVCFEGLAFRHE